MAHRTAKITYDLKDRGYKLNGTDRNNINVPALVSMINSAATQELVKNGALIGYYGHQFRLLFDMNVPESAVVGGKVVRLEPAVRTVYLHSTPDGKVTHQQEFLDNDAGKKAYKQYKANIGGFSSAVDYFKGTLPKQPARIYGFDYVFVPNYLDNTAGIAFEAAFDSLHGDMPSDSPQVLAMRQELEASIIHIFDSLHQEATKDRELDDAYTRIAELEQEALNRMNSQQQREQRQRERQESVFDSLICPTVPVDHDAPQRFLYAQLPVLDDGSADDPTEQQIPTVKPISRLLKFLGR